MDDHQSTTERYRSEILRQTQGLAEKYKVDRKLIINMIKSTNITRPVNVNEGTEFNTVPLHLRTKAASVVVREIGSQMWRKSDLAQTVLVEPTRREYMIEAVRTLLNSGKVIDPKWFGNIPNDTCTEYCRCPNLAQRRRERLNLCKLILQEDGWNTCKSSSSLSPKFYLLMNTVFEFHDVSDISTDGVVTMSVLPEMNELNTEIERVGIKNQDLGEALTEAELMYKIFQNEAYLPLQRIFWRWIQYQFMLLPPTSDYYSSDFVDKFHNFNHIFLSATVAQGGILELVLDWFRSNIFANIDLFLLFEFSAADNSFNDRAPTLFHHPRFNEYVQAILTGQHSDQFANRFCDLVVDLLKDHSEDPSALTQFQINWEPVQTLVQRYSSNTTAVRVLADVGSIILDTSYVGRSWWK